MFKIIEPKTWLKIVGRVAGANFGNIYANSTINTANYKLPKGHSWESFTYFLLDTLPKNASDHYKEKFNKFIKWWTEKGSGMRQEDIDILNINYNGAIFQTGEMSTRGNKDKEVIKFNHVVDTIPELDSKQDVLTWKRMAMCIIKNDYFCKSLSFGISKEQLKRRKETMKKYESIL